MIKQRNSLKILIIPGIFSEGVGFSFDHCSDFQLTVDGVLMTRANLLTYFSNGRTLPNAQTLRRRSEGQVHRQVYFSGIYFVQLAEQYGFRRPAA